MARTVSLADAAVPGLNRAAARIAALIPADEGSQPIVLLVEPWIALGELELHENGKVCAVAMRHTAGSAETPAAS